MTLDREDIEAIAEAVARRIARQTAINHDAAYLASLTKEQYDALIDPQFRADKSSRRK